MFYVYNKTDDKMMDVVWPTINKAVSSCRYLTKTHGKQYVVLSPVYDSQTYDDEQHEARRQAEFDQYGCD